MRCRGFALGLVFLAVAGLFAGRLWQLQIRDGAEYWLRSRQSAGAEILTAARGEITDRKGNLLVWDRLLEDGSLQRTCEETVAPHVLGRVGPVPAEQAEDYRSRGYAAGERVGLSGAEQAFEEQLRGADGLVDASGEILLEPRPGSTVVLTIDLELQAAMEAALERALGGLGEEARGAAAVALEVSSGAVLAAASLPDYDLSDFGEAYGRLSTDPDAPLVNRAFQGRYAPGSTFKLVTAAAALSEGCVTGTETIDDCGPYDFYDDYRPACWLWRSRGEGHGPLTVTEALEHSCNYYFYEAGRRLGIDRLNDYARRFGLGEKTGLELGETAGVLAGPESRADRGQVWYEGELLPAAIGQSDNAFSPLQLAAMTAAVANGGSRWRCHVLQEVRSWDGTEVLQRTVPECLGELGIAPEHLALLRQGMRQAAEGPLKEALSAVPVSVAAKTGTAQVDGQAANGVFVCFAPCEEPEIALAIVLEGGGAGSALAGTAAEMLSAWFEA